LIRPLLMVITSPSGFAVLLSAADAAASEEEGRSSERTFLRSIRSIKCARFRTLSGYDAYDGAFEAVQKSGMRPLTVISSVCEAPRKRAYPISLSWSSLRISFRGTIRLFDICRFSRTGTIKPENINMSRVGILKNLYRGATGRTRCYSINRF
jgi:hypothetical protein